MPVTVVYINPLISPVVALLFPTITILIIIFGAKKNALRPFLMANAFFVFALFSFTLAGFIIVQTNNPYTKVDLIILIFCLFLIISGLFALRFRKKIPNQVYLLVFVVFQTYFIFEIVVNVLVSNGYFGSYISISDPMLGTFSKPCLEPDLIRGYRWHEEDIRLLKVVRGKEVFDNTFRVNNDGYHSGKDYKKRKAENVKRFIVFGDSYTAAEFLKTPWPDATEGLLQKESTLFYPEMYSFALDGIGLSNWHSIFFNEIANQYDFDGIILAVYDDDLQRDFFMMYSDSAHVYGSYSEKPPADMRAFETVYKKSMYIAGNIQNETVLNQKRQSKEYSTAENLPVSNLFILHKLYSSLKKIEYDVKKRNSNIDEENDTFYIIDTEPINQLRKPEKIKMLDDIIGFCKNNNKEVILISVPHIELVRNNVFKRKKSISQKELEYISTRYSLPYFDLYPYFEILPCDSLKQMYLNNDGHWNQQGSDYFAGIVARLLKPFFN